MEFQIEPLGAHHHRGAFSCGVSALDNYLHTQAGQDVKRRVAAVFVLTPDSRLVAGYYTLSQYSIVLEAIPEAMRRKLPRYPLVPATLLGRFAVAVQFRGRGLGAHLLMDALHRAWAHSKNIASAAVVVDAKDQMASSFYRKYGFIEIPVVPSRLFLSMAIIERMFV